MGLTSRLAGFVSPDSEKAYFFLGDLYVRYDVAGDGADPGYPLKIADNWPSLFTEDIDAALCWPDGNVYFFKGDQYIKYDWATDRAADGYPLPIATMWPGVFESDIDAAVRWPGDIAFFFKDGEYLTYDLVADRVNGSPLPITEKLTGLSEAGIDVALVWPGAQAYFFHSSSHYSKYDIEAGRIADGYPRPVEGNWRGLSIQSTRAGLRLESAGGSADGLSVAAPASGGSVREYFPLFSKPLEGRIPYMYQDIKGLVTVAVGNLIDTPADASALPFENRDTHVAATKDEIVVEWHMIKNAPGLAQGGHRAAEKIHTLVLSEAAMDEVIRRRFDINEARLANFYSSWATWPADARLGAHSIAWTGSYFPNKWPNFNAAANVGDWATAADQSQLDKAGNPGLVERNKANFQLFVNAAAVITQGLDPSMIYYPTAL